MESTLSTRIVKELNQLPHCHAEKRWTGGIYSKVGEPDVTGAIYGLRFEIEVKEPGKKVQKVQAARLKAWAESGAIVGVAWSVEDAVRIVTEGLKAAAA